MTRGVRRRLGGFTLIELLVALAIFAVMAVAAYRGLSVMLDARARVEQENRQWRDLALFFARLGNDLGATLGRPVRGASGLVLPALSGQTVAAGEDDAQLALTRSGYADQVGVPGGPRRVGYRLRGETVELLTWAVLDQAPRSRPDVAPALKGVKDFTLRYLDRSGNWQPQWPPADQNDALPSALEVKIVLLSGAEVRRVFALP